MSRRVLPVSGCILYVSRCVLRRAALPRASRAARRSVFRYVNRYACRNAVLCSLPTACRRAAVRRPPCRRADSAQPRSPGIRTQRRAAERHPPAPPRRRARCRAPSPRRTATRASRSSARRRQREAFLERTRGASDPSGSNRDPRCACTSLRACIDWTPMARTVAGLDPDACGHDSGKLRAALQRSRRRTHPPVRANGRTACPRQRTHGATVGHVADRRDHRTARFRRRTAPTTTGLCATFPR